MAHKNHILCRQKWMETLAKRHTSSGAFIFNEQNQLLILKPSYKDGWNLPSGITEVHESPYQTVIRECKEETNLNIEIQDLVLVDYIREKIKDKKYDYVEFYFTVKATNLSDITIDNEEIIDYKFIDLSEAQEYLTPIYYKRLTAVLEAKSYPVLFSDGRPFSDTSSRTGL